MGGAKRAKVPPAPAPTPSPVPLDVETLEKQRSRRRQRIRQFGRAGTILTSGGLGTSEDASKKVAELIKGTLLGGSA
jgi:hypothetical protein